MWSVSRIFVGLVCALNLFVCLPSTASATLTPLTDNTEFVRQAYRDFLNREPDAVGLAYWANQLNTGVLDYSELIEQHLLSPEFQGNVAPVVRLYFAYFNRLPDYDGLFYWVGLYDQGTALGTISAAFATSAEFQSTYGSLDNAAFVNLVYQNVLGRQPDADGLAYWTGMLDAGEMSRGEVMTGFSESAEYRSLMANSVYITMTYIGLLRRAPDQEGFNYWVGIMDQGATGLALIDGFLYSYEYEGRFNGTWVITGLEILGPTSVDELESATYSAKATWEGGRTSLLTPLWSDNSWYASIGPDGLMTTLAVTSDQSVTITATYSSGGAMRSDTHDVTIKDIPPGIPELSVGVSHNLYIDAYATDIYRFTATVSRPYRIALTNTKSDLSWDLADNYEFMTGIYFCDNYWTTADEVCITPISLVQGKTYYLAIDEWDYVSGSYTLRIDPQ